MTFEAMVRRRGGAALAAALSLSLVSPAQSTLSSPRVRDVLKRVHMRAAALGMLDANILTVGGTPLAFNYNYLAGDRTYGLRSGFDQTAGLDNCGKILIFKMLEDQNSRRRQHRNLLVVLHGLESRAHGDFGLAVANVAAEQPIHRRRRFHVARDVGDR